MEFTELVNGVQHIGVPTNDLDETIRFYHQLGFVTALETYNEAAKHRAAFLQLGDVIIETYENHCAVGHPGAIEHIALSTTDVDAAFEKARGLGLEMVHDYVRFLPFWQYGVRFFTVIGPNKEKIEFCQKLTEPYQQ